MVALPNPTIDAIYCHYEQKAEKEPPREYLGASIIGKECPREIWYSYRNVVSIKHLGRVLRLFETGHREEQRIIENLRAIGVEVLDRDPATKEQWRYSLLDGQLSCGLDGVLLGLPEAPKTWHLLECKTANKKSYDKIEKEGIAKAKPVYLSQVQLCMGMAELTRCLFVVQCKDDDRLYMERIEFDDKIFKALLLKAKRIIDAESPPDKISEKPDSFSCRFCDFANVCHNNKIPSAICRTCVHWSPAGCSQGHEIKPNCPEHIYIPGLLEGWAEPQDGDPTWVRYKQFVNVASSGFPASDLPHYSSQELQHCDPAAIGNPAVESARAILGGTVTEK